MLLVMVCTQCVYTYCYTLCSYNSYNEHSNMLVYNSTYMYLCKTVFFQMLTSVVKEHTIALKYVLTLMEASHVDVMMVII